MIRKKSGEPVRSSLKGSRPKLRADLSIVTAGLDIQTSKSEPTTPNKSVHFDSKLEHVRLFIAAQKPLAVSVDGSPTEDTSGTESDFPSFIFGDSVRPVPVVMQLSNMPPIINVHSDVALEELKMSPSSLDIVGSARVRNLAFEKRVAVRFTFDAWQTTSEVTAKFISSIGNSFDRFGFTIRLSDIMSRVEGKTLVLALRYSVDGRDIWDNNGGGNYVATFKKAPLASRVKTKIEELSSESDVAVLQEKLETVVRKRDRATTAGATSMSKQTSEPTTLRQLPLSLSARYDFSNSWRNSWSGASSSQTEAYGRRHSPTNVSSIPWPAKQGEKKASALSGKPLLGSPREPDWMGSTVSSNALTNPELRDPDAMNTPGGTPRRHQRGYFDYVSPLDNTTLRRTPPGTPKLWSLDDLTPVSSPKLSFGGIQRADEAGTDMFSPPPLLTVSSSDMALGTAFFPALQRMGSTESDASTSSILSGDESTPSIVSPSSGSSRSSSPCPSDTSITSPHEDYSQFLNRFCFFTGDSSSSPLRPPMLARSSSSSSVSSSGSSQSVAISASSSTTTITPTPSTACLGSADDSHNLSTPRIAFTPPPAPAGIST
ncbi:putative phosphatase regulatory subunit-domain-containing protein [Schizophyllum commune]